MKRTTYYVVAFATLAASCNPLAVGGGRLAEVTIVDRDTGTVLTPYHYRGEYWIAGRPGAHYCVEIHNRLGERVLAVTSVDGVNVISGETANWDQTGYVFNPEETYQITGWRKSDTEVAAFTFTASPNSYAERTGRPANVGVIGVALFRERPPPQAAAIEEAPRRGREPVPAPSAAPPAEETFSQAPTPFGGTPNKSPSASAAPPPATSGQATGLADSRARAVNPSAEPSPSAAAAIPPPPVESLLEPGRPIDRPLAPKLGTGHGEREYSFATHTQFTRLQDRPNEVIRIRYDSLNNLVAMGIIPHPRPHVPTVNPFPDSPEQHYVPDPPSASLEDP
jgi:hypothetical protein